MTKFVRLETVLKPWLDTPLAGLPADIRSRISEELFPLPWDLLSPYQREEAALQWDAMHDPQSERARELSWELVVRKDQLEAELAECQKLSPSPGRDKLQQDNYVAKLQSQLQRTNWLLEHAPLVSPPQASTPVASPAYGVQTGYLSFPTAMERLHTRLGATRDELAGWIFKGPEDGGIAAYRNPNESDPPPRFFFDISLGDDYLAPLMSCWFVENDIEDFEPQDRFITGAALIERWGQQANIQAESFIRAKVAESRLLEIHPILGSTQATFPDDDWLPPIGNGLFLRAHMETVEAEDFGGALRVKSEGETPEQRAQRLRDRKEQLRAERVGSFLQCIADEEGISVSRVKQILNRPSKKEPSPKNGLAGRPRGWGGRG